MSDKKPTPDREKKPSIKTVAKEAPADEKGGFRDAGLAEPTRFGDWEVKGRCSDF